MLPAALIAGYPKSDYSISSAAGISAKSSNELIVSQYSGAGFALLDTISNIYTLTSVASLNFDCAYAEGYYWVACNGSIKKVSTAGSVIATYATSGQMYCAAYAAGAIFSVSFSGARLYKIDIATGTVSSTAVTNANYCFASSNGKIYVSSNSTLLKSFTTNLVAVDNFTLPTSADRYGIIEDGTYIYQCDYSGNRLTRTTKSAGTAGVLCSGLLTSAYRCCWIDSDRIAVTSYSAGVVYIISVSGNNVLQTLSMGSSFDFIVDVKYLDGRLFASNMTTGKVKVFKV